MTLEVKYDATGKLKKAIRGGDDFANGTISQTCTKLLTGDVKISFSHNLKPVSLTKKSFRIKKQQPCFKCYDLCNIINSFFHTFCGGGKIKLLTLLDTT